MLVPATARAQTDNVETAKPADATTKTDLYDLWRHVRHHDEDERTVDIQARKPFFVVAPSIGSKPSTGLNGGFSGNIAFIDGDADTTHISSIIGGLKLSQKGQTLSGVKFAIFAPGDRWFVQGDNRLSWTSLNTYPLGAEALAGDAENLKYDQFRLYETVYREIQHHRLFIGGGISYSRHGSIRPGSGAAGAFDESAYVAYSDEHGFNAAGQTSAGTSVSLLYDSRDNAINAHSGWLASATYRTFFSGFMGGDSTWQELQTEARTYRPLTKDGRRRLAFWFMSDMVTGGTAPYLDLPATAADGRSARGYAEGRYRGDRLMYGEVEYRDTLTRNGLVGFVAFLNTTTVDSDAGERLFEGFAPGAGFGFRFLLNKKSRTNLCTDYGWGKNGSRGFYLAIQEAF